LQKRTDKGSGRRTGFLQKLAALLIAVVFLAGGIMIGQHLPKKSREQVTVATVSAKLNANFPEQSNSSPLRKCPKPAKILYF
jgi:hypothetical protein